MFSYIVSFNFLCWAVQKFHFWGIAPRKTTKFGQNNCLTCKFLHCEFLLTMLSSSKVLFWGFTPPSPKFLHCKFQLSILSSLKVSFWGFCPPGGPPNLVKIIVSRTSSYIVSFNFLYLAVQNGPFLDSHFGGSLWHEASKKEYANNPTFIRSPFTNSHIFTLSGLEGVSATSDWSEEKKEK